LAVARIVAACWLAQAVSGDRGRALAPAVQAEPAPFQVRLPMLATDLDPPPPSITVAFVGDISLARGLVTRMEAEGPSYPFRRVLSALDADLAFGNLEGALTERGQPWPKAYTFRTPPELAAGLRDAGFDVVSLANNHALDYGPTGLADTRAALDTLGIAAVGAGGDAAAAMAPAILQANGLRIAFLACVATPDESGGFSIREWAARPATPGVAICDPAAVAAGVAAGRALADFVVLAVHAGDEYSTTPNAIQGAIAEAALAAGADAVIGAHPHVVQPLDIRGTQVIAWSLGNFVFDLDDVDLANIPPPRVSLVLRLTFTLGQGVTEVDPVPLVLDDAEDRPRPATPDESAVLDGLLHPRR
jgi:poly-gamma-glutamate synthesis protein (capsule biosynthesis protein)